MTETSDLTDRDDPGPEAPSGGWRRHLPLLFLASGALLGAVVLHDRLDLAALAAHREALLGFRNTHFAASLGAFVLLYTLMVAFSLPGATVATLCGGFLFGTILGTAANVTGATLGAVALFLTARHGIGARMAARLDASSGRIRRIKAGIDASQWEMLFLIRLVPLVPFVVANLVPALVGVPLGRFAISTFLGIIPGALVYTSVGAGLGEVLARGEVPDLGVIFTPPVLLPLLGLALLAALPLAVKLWRRDREDPS